MSKVINFGIPRSRTFPAVIGKQRNHAHASVGLCLRNELTSSRVSPMSEDYCGKRTLTPRYDLVGRYQSAGRARVSYIVDHSATEFFESPVVSIQRLVRVIVKHVWTHSSAPLTRRARLEKRRE